MSSPKNESSNTPHSVHVIGVGRTGATYVEALLRTGEIEDNLSSNGTSFSALLIDIGEDDIFIADDYARSFKSRLAVRNVPLDKFHYESVVLSLPDAATFNKNLDGVRNAFTAAGGTDLIRALPEGFQMPKLGEHTPRAVAKALNAFGLYLGDKPLAGALQRFVDQVKKSNGAATILVAFGLAGGTGSGTVLDLARALRSAELGADVRIVGLGQLSHSGDGNYHDSLAQTMAIEDLERAMSSNAANKPFPTACFIVSSEQSWQRLSSYTSTGLKEVRHRFKQMVTNRFVADSFMRWAVKDGFSHLHRVLSHGIGKLIAFNVAKLSHPGVQVLPGEAVSKWDAVLQQWVSFIPKYSGLTDKFISDYSEAHVYTSRNMKADVISSEIRKMLTSTYARDSASEYVSYVSEFFDELTAYANIILVGVTKEDLGAYEQGKTQADKQATSKALEQA